MPDNSIDVDIAPVHHLRAAFGAVYFRVIGVLRSGENKLPQIHLNFLAAYGAAGISTFCRNWTAHDRAVLQLCFCVNHLLYLRSIRDKRKIRPHLVQDRQGRKPYRI